MGVIAPISWGVGSKKEKSVKLFWVYRWVYLENENMDFPLLMMDTRAYVIATPAIVR